MNNRCMKFNATNIISPFTVQLDASLRDKAFHVSQLRPWWEDLVPSQTTQDEEPGTVFVDEQGEKIRN